MGSKQRLDNDGRHFAVLRRSVVPWRQDCVSILAESPEEQLCFEWFTVRASKKMAGAFVMPFWDTLIMQASLQEPAVLHAVLALGSIHKQGIISRDSKDQESRLLDKQEQFMLQHYVKATRLLQPYFISKDGTSVRVALVTCIVFTCLEFIQSHLYSAQLHLQNGLKLLKELQCTSELDGNSIYMERACDAIISQAFSRLCLQVDLFRQSYHHLRPILPTSETRTSVSIFQTLTEAWMPLEGLLVRILALSEKVRQRRCTNNSILDEFSPIVDIQRQICSDLASWLNTFEASRLNMAQKDFSGKACYLLREYLAMANIMAKTCLRPDDESIYDSFTDQFLLIIEQSLEMCKISRSNSQLRVLPRNSVNFSESMVDVGWIPPLYYTALKCRAHRIRLQAIRLIESSSHREAIWDSNIAAAVARRVMELEEMDFYGDTSTIDSFKLFSSPSPKDLYFDNLPDSNRLNVQEVILGTASVGNASLCYKQRDTTGEWENVRVNISLE